MKIRIRNPKDFWAGVFFLAVGAGAAWLASGYRMGSAAQMGPGFFPMMLAGLLTILGIVILLGGLLRDGEKVEVFALRPLFWILGAVVLFGLIAKSLGFLLSIVVLVIVSAFGGHEFKWKEALIAAIVLAVLSVGVFVYGLKLPFPVFPAFWS